MSERITNKIAAFSEKGNHTPFFSLEFFPPRTQSGFSNLRSRIERISQTLHPLFVAVTWGANGTTSSRSLELAELCQVQLGITTCLHLTCTNMRRQLLDDALEEAKTLGIRNILALRGDAPRTAEYMPDIKETSNDSIFDSTYRHDIDSNETFNYASDLVRYIRQKYNDYFCVGVAAYPEGHADESHPADQNSAHDIPYLVEKCRAGADFIMTQLFYDENSFISFERTLREHESGVFKTMPIIPGLMPIQNYQILKRTTVLSHTTLPKSLLEQLLPIQNDDEAVKAIGIKYLVAMIRQIRSSTAINQDQASRTPTGFHFFTLNLERAVTAIIEQCQLIPAAAEEPKVPNAETIESPLLEQVQSFVNRTRTLSTSSGRRPSTQLTTNEHRDVAGALPKITHSDHDSLDQSAAHDDDHESLSREATWDEFPNGRFGDARSPAYNAPLTYSFSTLHVTPHEALRLWETPTCFSHISDLFISHLNHHRPPRLPWSDSVDDNFAPETLLIRPDLVRLTRQKSFWTIASQPAVNGVRSDDRVHGWGPPDGFVFQKPFVEFFMPLSVFQASFKSQLDNLYRMGELSYYAITSDMIFQSSDSPATSAPSSSPIGTQISKASPTSSSAIHAVTWGSFKGKEIVTATMVEEISFKAWAQDAFEIWTSWSRCLGDMMRRHGSSSQERAKLNESRQFLQTIGQSLVLVNIVGHDFQQPRRFWDILHEQV